MENEGATGREANSGVCLRAPIEQYVMRRAGEAEGRGERARVGLRSFVFTFVGNVALSVKRRIFKRFLRLSSWCSDS